jgi:hypothetical protein
MILSTTDPGDELRIIHPLYLLRVFPMPVPDLGLLFIEGEALLAAAWYRPDSL